MHRSIYLSFAALSLVLATFAPISTSAQAVPENQPQRMPSMSKGTIENPLKGMINPSYLTPKPVATKPAAIRTGLTSAMVAPEVETGVDADGNIKVKPGAINWHKNFDDARAASVKSGKPVLSFAMIGSLDDKFC